jgi:alpha/beta hydrolase family protein
VTTYPHLMIFAALALGSMSLPALAANDIDGRFDVGGRSIHLKCEGTGTPVVVVDAGLGTPPAEDAGWQAIASKVSPATRICLYDRAGLGTSDPAKARPRTSKDAATDLHAALKAAHVDGPYLLVGHSIGGLHVQVFASLYPDDTAGLVLVSSTHPDQSRTWLALLGPAKPGEEKAVTDARTFIGTVQTDPTQNEEGLDITPSAEQARQLHSLGSKPVIVATHSPRFRMVPGLSEPVAIKLEDGTQRLQKQFLTLSTNAHQNIAATAGHGLPHEDPAFVVANILQGVAAVRGQGTR